MVGGGCYVDTNLYFAKVVLYDSFIRAKNAMFFWVVNLD
ncbi:hypothetical protein HBZS_109850 [Helicobacter bizzozeronii CCUG 35545]|nr:hypothetical protein HBZS_109850 [Helicobacter bizzozeronii CCUG 35545]